MVQRYALGGAITCALMQRRYEDAKILEPGYDTTEALSSSGGLTSSLSASVVAYQGFSILASSYRF